MVSLRPKSSPRDANKLSNLTEPKQNTNDGPLCSFRSLHYELNIPLSTDEIPGPSEEGHFISGPRVSSPVTMDTPSRSELGHGAETSSNPDSADPMQTNTPTTLPDIQILSDVQVRFGPEPATVPLSRLEKRRREGPGCDVGTQTEGRGAPRRHGQFIVILGTFPKHVSHTQYQFSFIIVTIILSIHIRNSYDPS